MRTETLNISGSAFPILFAVTENLLHEVACRIKCGIDFYPSLFMETCCARFPDLVIHTQKYKKLLREARAGRIFADDMYLFRTCNKWMRKHYAHDTATCFQL